MHFVGFIDLRFLFIIIRKVPKDRKEDYKLLLDYKILQNKLL